MNLLKKIGGYLLIAALGLAAFFSQRAKTAQATAKLAQEREKIADETAEAMARIFRNTHDLSKKHNDEIAQEHKKRRSADRDQLNGDW